MGENITDWLAMLGRWAHIITGIAWIGSSFFFNWLDGHFEAPTDEDQSEANHHAHIKWGSAINGSLIFAYIEPSCLEIDQPSITWVKKLLLNAKAYILSNYVA